MKNVIILLFVICITSCSKNDENSPGTKLVSIEYNDDNRIWTENYSYNSNSELNLIENFFPGRRYEIQYENNQLKEYATFRVDEDRLIFRDSIVYNDNGTIKEINVFSINAGGNSVLSHIYEFEYDERNKVAKKSTYVLSVQEYRSTEKYYWKGENIERVEYYNGEDLSYEYFYKYDNKINYKRDIPTSLSDPVNWSKNNVVEMDWNDFEGNLDVFCKPVTAKYRYNLKKYPVSIKLNRGREMTLEYE